jgi:GxxExxY protein
LDINEITEKVIGAAIEVHSQLVPGLLESAYEDCLCRELALRDISFKKQLTLPLEYKGVKLDSGFRVDLLIEEAVVIEAKAVESILPVHEAQLLTYLKLGKWKVGLLINFNVARLKEGIKRVVLGLEE